ncbi:FKBP-type peptidyl-prolyl cis-trans isomerase [Flavobacterium sp. GT3R68]|uniref:FKBP-type peptidyl-prolyl cis-trans isomerase n=1 Tax=Flavobacterium sp. GT3R68 TaxID=2594437 RepID=UPI000F866A0C|nr:FKBP-type peptidylprolyl isomerase [Flavobacterium sp. GT3R68]RTY86777.1 FKBP-type peptidylprolyl isomerase [Flavobacterium sp. GSN2]TRW89389.1 FKBP-type peptidylprolyl isomerase [Flavobacterium sp. GT3R68]
MNKIYKLLLILIITVFAVSCVKDDSPNIVPPKDYKVQYTEDLATIDRYLDEYYMEVTPDFDVTFTKIPVGGTQQSIRLQTTYPLQSKIVKNEDHDVDYKVYYISFQEGVGESTTAVDSVYVAYKGKSIYHQSDEILPATNPKTYVDNIYDKQFDYAQNPVWFPLESVVQGWSEIIPMFKTGTYSITEGPDPVTFTGFGAGVMFLPSGLGYYNRLDIPGIPAYSPLVFNFKLQKQRARDHDRDGVLSKYEVAAPTAEVPNPKQIDYDTDGDGIANFYDLDDDGDLYYTRDEVRKPTTHLGSKAYYPYNPIADNPATTQDESEPKGIPSKDIINTTTQEPDGTTPTRLRRHLDPTAKPPYTVY